MLKIIITIMIATFLQYCTPCTVQQFSILQTNKNTPQQLSSCFRHLLRNADLPTLFQIITQLQQQQKSIIIKLFEQQLHRLQLLQQQIILGHSTCQPTLKWGQNITHIFITLKTSHRWDSPPCLHTKMEQSFLNQSRFAYSNLCLVSHQLVNFTVGLEMYREVKVDGKKGENREIVGYRVEKNGVGTYSTIIEKMQAQIWPFLDKTERTFGNWAQISQRYESDFKVYSHKLSQILKSKRQISQKFNLNLLLSASTLLFLIL